MGNIVGEKFDSYVSGQIAVRQALQSQGFLEGNTRDYRFTQLLNSQNAWLKLSSSVRVQNTPAGKKRLTDIGLNNADNFMGNDLARKTVLFNTLSTVTPASYKDNSSYSSNPVTATNASVFQRAGVSTANTLWNDKSSYGLGGNKFGITPPPGLISAKIDCKNRGSIREATVQMKCYNQFQFELLELVYLRLGYSMLLEWGWDKYISNKGALSQMSTTLCENEWFNESKSSNFQSVLDKITQYRKTYQGNYDGFMGKVVNFDWKFGQDGTYDITLKLITSGDVIESLKVNLPSVGVPVAAIQLEASGSATTENILDSTIVATAGSSTLSYDLYTDITSDVEKWTAVKDYMAWYSILAEDVPSLNAETYINEDENQENGAIANLDNYNYFMTFKQLLDKVQTLILPNISGNSILGINNSENDNICSIFPYLISFDPKVCLIKPFILDERSASTATADKDTTIFTDWSWMTKMKEFGVIENSGATLYGKPMNIYLNYDFISKTLNDVNEKGEILLFKFLSKICDGINDALGGCTKLEPILTEDRWITIIDQNPINGIEKSAKFKDRFAVPASTKFEIYGYNTENNTSNFVRDFGFTTKITPELASMISIGAASSNTSTKNYDGTAFSKWNEGLFDAYQMDYVDPKTRTDKKQDNPLSDAQIEEIFKKFQGSSIDTADGNDLVNDAAKAYNGSWLEKTVSTVTEAVGLGDAKAEDTTRKENNIEFSIYGKSAKGLRDVFFSPLSGKSYQNVSWEDFALKEADWWQSEVAKKAAETNTDDGKGNYFEYLAASFGGKKRGQAILKSMGTVKYQQLNPDWISQGKAAFQGFQNQINTALYSTIQQPSNVAGFIPIDCNLTCDGISGIKIYQQLEVRQDFLPKQYPKAVKFLITKVNHDISDNDWKTSLGTVSTPATKGLESADLKVSVTEVINKIEEKKGFDPVTRDESNLRCLAGTDMGVKDGYENGKKVLIRVCKLYNGVLVNASESYKYNQFFLDINADPTINPPNAKKKTVIAAWGWRSMETQIATGAKNGCPANWTKSSDCRVPTARAGYSNHQMGKALDVTVNGSTIQSRKSKEFQWLAKNGSKYGLINFPREAWHWSVNGK
jgi:LAS superfamily LD-carboxypeptidase LdcB